MDDEHAYLERRYEQEKAAASRAACASARAAHEELARYFGLRLKFCPAAATVGPKRQDPLPSPASDPAAGSQPGDVPPSLDPVLVPSA